MTKQQYSVANHTVGATGYGLMGFTWKYDPTKEYEDEDSFAAMKAALTNGANFWNSGDFYGYPDKLSNLKLLRRYFDKYPEDADKIFLSVKGGSQADSVDPDGSAESVARTLQNVKDILGDSKKLDMFTLARIGDVPIEETVKAIDQHIKRGDIGSYCLSETSADTIRRAHKVRPIDAIEIEVSLWSREAEFNGVFAVCKELGIPVIAYSPVGRGLLTGRYKSRDDIPENSLLTHFERSQEDNLKHNLQLVDKVEGIAQRNNCTAAQVALSWLRNLSNDGKHPVIIPIPGSTNAARVVENCTHISIPQRDLDELNSFLDSFSAEGGRYWADHEQYLYK
jgi:pyridoxine 4-dehydrogenase